MKRILLFVSLCLTAAGCATLEPKITDRTDPFTGVRTRTLSVGESSSYQTLAALAALNTNPYANRRPSASLLPDNQFIQITVGPTDTTLTFVRIYPEKGYDVPAASEVLVKFADTKTNGGSSIALPIVRQYHTTGGSLLVTARVGRNAMTAIQREMMDLMRVDQVSANESDYQPVDWYVPIPYAKAFLKGASLLFPVRSPIRSRR